MLVLKPVCRCKGCKTAASANEEGLAQRGLFLLVVSVLPHLDEEKAVSREELPVQRGCGGLCGKRP